MISLLLAIIAVLSGIVCVAAMTSKTIKDKRGLFGLGTFLSLLLFGFVLIG